MLNITIILSLIVFRRGLKLYERSDKKLRWTDKEIRYLENKYEVMNIDHISKKLQRSPRSIKHKALDLGLSTKAGEYLHARTLSTCFGRDMRVIRRWMEECNLPYKVVYRNSHPFYLIHPDDIWIWAESHKDEIDWRRYHRYSILPEPSWIEQAIKSQKHLNHRLPISVHDKALVMKLRRQGYTHKQIAKELDRTVDSVKHIYRQEMSKHV